MYRMRLPSAAAAAALTLAALTVPAGQAVAGTAGTGTPAPRVTALPVPDGTWRSDVTAGDSTGRYLIGDAAVYVDGVTGLQPLLWVGGRLATLAIPYADPTLADVNAAGTVVGSGSDGTHRIGFRYHNGTFTVLPGLHATSGSSASFVNNRGDILGYSVESDSAWELVMWPAGHPNKPREVTGHVGTNAVGLDEDGTVLFSGWSDTATTYRSYPDGTVQQVSGPSGSADFYVVAVTGGWLAGFDQFSTNALTVAWNPRRHLVNQAPELYGAYSVNGRGDLGSQGVIDRRFTGPVTVPDLGGGACGVKVLSDTGLAAGFASDEFHTVHAVVWTGY